MFSLLHGRPPFGKDPSLPNWTWALKAKQLTCVHATGNGARGHVLGGGQGCWLSHPPAVQTSPPFLLMPALTSVGLPPRQCSQA